MKLSFIIVTWNRLGEIKECVNSLKNQDYSKKKYEVIVIDAGNDGTFDYLKNNYSWIKVFKHENVGPAQLRNFAVKKAKGEFLWFLDSDTKFLNNHVIKDSLNVIQRRKDIGAFGCEFVDGDKVKQHNMFFNGDGYYSIIDKEFCILNEVPMLATANLITRRDLFDKVNGFDSDYFYLFEDTDYCLKIRKLGYKVICDSRVQVLHEPSSMSRVANFVNFHKNRVRFVFVNNFFLGFLLPIIDLLSFFFYLPKKVQQFKYSLTKSNKGTNDLKSNNFVSMFFNLIKGYLFGYIINFKDLKKNFKKYIFNKNTLKGVVHD